MLNWMDEHLAPPEVFGKYLILGIMVAAYTLVPSILVLFVCCVVTWQLERENLIDID